MSQENVETVEAFYAAFTQGDEASMGELLNADIEWDTTARIDGRVTHGIEDTRASVEEGFSSFDGVRIEPQEMRDAGDEIAVRLRGWFRGASSGVENRDQLGGGVRYSGRKDWRLSRLRDVATGPRSRGAAGVAGRRDTGRAMSQENVEIVRASFEAWNAGDMDALRDLYHEDAVTRGLDNWPEAGPNVGRRR